MHWCGIAVGSQGLAKVCTQPHGGHSRFWQDGAQPLAHQQGDSHSCAISRCEGIKGGCWWWQHRIWSWSWAWHWWCSRASCQAPACHTHTFT